MKPAESFVWSWCDALTAPPGSIASDPTVCLFALREARLSCEAACATAAGTTIFLPPGVSGAKLASKGLSLSRAARGETKLGLEAALKALQPLLAADVRPAAFTATWLPTGTRVWLLPVEGKREQLEHVLNVPDEAGT